MGCAEGGGLTGRDALFAAWIWRVTVERFSRSCLARWGAICMSGVEGVAIIGPGRLGFRAKWGGLGRREGVDCGRARVRTPNTHWVLNCGGFFTWRSHMDSIPPDERSAIGLLLGFPTSMCPNIDPFSLLVIPFPKAAIQQ